MESEETPLGGGYDEGYRMCPCFWGREPGSLILKLHDFVPQMQDLRVLDAGCGEGKNAAYLASKGAIVHAIDVSEIAISKARITWTDAENVNWELADVRELAIPSDTFDVIVAYGLMHCLVNETNITNAIKRMKKATKGYGFNVVCTFNDRYQELGAHPGFHPCLLPHKFYVDLYSDWDILLETDSDLRERHPHNNIDHTHSMTRLIARRKESR